MTPSEAIQALSAVGVALAPVAIVSALVHRRRFDRIDGAVILVLWGLSIVVLEHAFFGFSSFGGTRIRVDHSAFHFQMLAAYGLAAFALVAVVLVPLIFKREAVGWYGLLVLAIIGVGAEVATAFVTSPHGAPQFQIGDLRGMFLWGYPVAWVTALVLSFRPTFSADTGVANSAHL